MQAANPVDEGCWVDATDIDLGPVRNRRPSATGDIEVEPGHASGRSVGIIGGFRHMVRHHDNGMTDFQVLAPGASVVELTVDFGNGFVRTLGMKRIPDGVWTIRLHGVSNGVRYRYRVDGLDRPEPDSPKPDPEGWTWIAHAA